MVQALIFGYAATYDLNHVPYAVLDQDHSAASRQLLAGLDGSGIFERVANLQRAGDIRSLIDARRALLIVQIDQQFERRLLSGQSADVQVIADGRNSNTAGTAAVYLNNVVEQFNLNWARDHGAARPPVRLLARAWYNPNLETRWFMIPGMIGTLTLLQTMMLTAMSVAREREQGTFDQLLVTPYRPFEIMAGKALPSMVVGTVQAGGVLLVAQLWFHIPFAGSYLVLGAGLLLFLAAAIGIGLLVSAVAATMQQALLYSILLIMPFSMLSGLTTPISSMPIALQYLTSINPLRYAIDITRRVYLEGAGLDLLISDLWPLALLAAITLWAASWMFSHRMQ
jgi:ABC-2 type transport system permease protein